MKKITHYTGLTWGFIQDLVSGINTDNVPKYAASLAYYTIFSLAPLLVIIINLCGWVFGKEAIRGELFSQINHLVGSAPALQIQDAIKNIHFSRDNVPASVISIVALIIGATGIFTEIRDSLNKIWETPAVKRPPWYKVILDRVLLFSLIVSLGFLLIVSLFINAVVQSIGNNLQHYFTHTGILMVQVIDGVLSLVGITFLVGLLFKTLPNAKVGWKDIARGATFTALLLTLGKLAIGYYLGKSNIGTIYGTAGSIMIIMIWVYYSSIILYLGALFTKIYILRNKRTIAVKKNPDENLLRR